MATAKSVNAANLEDLGAASLAQLLLEISAGDAAVKRRLRLALAGSAGPAVAMREIAKRLATIQRSKSFLDWDKIKALALDIDTQRRAILDLVAPADPRSAFDLLWQLIDCADSLYARCDDSNGRLGGVFHTAVHDLGPLAKLANMDSADLARRAFGALSGKNSGPWEVLISVLAPQLGQAGLLMLKASMEAWQSEPVVVPPEQDRHVVGWGSSGPLYADSLDSYRRQSLSAFALKEIADMLGDVDSYIAQFDSSARKRPVVAADIAQRLLAAGRALEASDVLDAAEKNGRMGMSEWEQARIDTLEALGQSERAQAARMECFLAQLNATHLRAFLAKLPDFEDFEAEQDALTHALTFGDIHQSLAFLVSWPDLARASHLVLARTAELNGDYYELLAPAAEGLDEKYPLAATLLHRAMIDFTLNNARSSRYKHAARHLSECAHLARRLPDCGRFPDHAAYESALRAAHGRKTGFWQQDRALR